MADPIVMPAAPPVVPVSNTPYPAVLTPAVATQTLNQYGIDPNAVLSAANIQQTINNPAPAPDDLLGIRSELYNTGGVNTSLAEYQAAQKAASDAALGLNERLTGLRGRAVSLSKIVGTQAQERAVSSNEIDALNEASRLALSQYQAKKSEADSQFAIRESEVTQKKALMAQYPGAKIKFTDSFESSIKKIDQYAEDQKKKVYKAALKAKAMELGLKTSGSRKELEKRIAKSSKAAVADAKKKSDLELELLAANIENTKKSTANIGVKSGDEINAIGTTMEVPDPNDPLNTIYIDKKTGKPVDIAKILQDAGMGQKQAVETGGWWNQFDISQPSTWLNF